MRTLSHKIIDLTPERVYGRTFRQCPNNPRSPGHHEAAINKYLAQGAGMMDDDDKLEINFPRFTDTYYPLLPALGVGWEDFWASLFPEDQLIWQPGEWSRDDTYGTPDGLMLDGDLRLDDCNNGEMRIAECKRTNKSMRPIEDKKNWLYVRQGLAMCAMCPYGIRRVEYHVLWAIHDYRKRPYMPVYDVTLVEFDEREIETWWLRMQAVKEKVQPE